MAARWNLVVSEQTDTDLRQLLASQGKGRKGELSRFVEEAVRNRIFDETVAAAKAANAGRSEQEIIDAIDEAVAWARGRR
jgi:hypothetical protein